MMANLIDRMEFYAEMVKANAFSPGALAIAFMLLYRHLNGRTGRCDPSIPALAYEAGLTARSVKRAVDELHKSGWWQIGQARGRGHTNAYLPRMEKVTRASPIRSGKGDADVTFFGAEKVTNQVRKGDTAVTRTSKNQEEESHTVDAHRVDAHRPAARSAHSRVRQADDGASQFETFWRIYPHRGEFSDPKNPHARNSWRRSSAGSTLALSSPAPKGIGYTSSSRTRSRGFVRRRRPG